MNLKLKTILILLLITIGTISGYSQKQDTILYSNGNIRSIEIKKDNDKILLEFFSEKGENLLTKTNFQYEYFDSVMLMSRAIVIEDKKIIQEIWYLNGDTIYNRTKFEPEFDAKVKKFFTYVSNNLVYPKEALNNEIEAKVMISFIVDRNGIIQQVKPLTNIGYDLEKSSIELINKYKVWGVLYLNSKPISCFFRLPISYRL